LNLRPTRLGWMAPTDSHGSADASLNREGASDRREAAVAAEAGATAPHRSGEAGSLERRLPEGAPPFKPLLAPLTFSGLDAEVFDHYRSAFQGMNLQVQLGGSGSGLAQVASSEMIAAAAASLKPGSPVAGVLVEGDMSLSATGTLTYRDKDQIFAFGHPFMQQGPVAFPMATADIVATVADQTYPYKLANVGTLVGAITHDRVTAVVGKIGGVPQMMPAEVLIRRAGEPSTRFSYRIVENRDLTPVLLQVVVANSLKKQWRYYEDGTYFLNSRLRLADGREIRTRGVYSIGPTEASIFDVVKDVVEPFIALYQNPFQPVEFAGIEVELDASDEGRLYQIQDVYIDRTEIRPGEDVEVKIAVQRHRGERMLKTIRVPIPAGIDGGQLTLRVADAQTVEKPGTVGGRLNPAQARDVDQLVSILNRSRSGDRCYVQLLRRAPGVVLQHQQMTHLPGSVRSVLQKTASSDIGEGIERTVLWEGELTFDGALVGNQDLSLAVLPSL